MEVLRSIRLRLHWFIHILVICAIMTSVFYLTSNYHNLIIRHLTSRFEETDAAAPAILHRNQTFMHRKNKTYPKQVRSWPNPCLHGHDWININVSELAINNSDAWKLIQHKDMISKTYLFSAFYDDRLAEEPSISILALSTHTNHENFTCQVYYEDVKVPYTVAASKHDLTMEQFSYNSSFIFQTRYVCRLKQSISPTLTAKFVALVQSPCETPSTVLEIFHRRQSHPVNLVGICLALSYGNGTTLENWVEWFEYYKIFGINEFNIYNCSLPSTFDKLFEYYFKEAAIRMVQMPTPITMPILREGCYLPVQLSLNDCLLRNMHRYQYIAFIDVDEFIIFQQHGVPQIAQVLQGAREHLHRKKEIWQYTFNNRYHFLEFSPDLSKPKYLKTLTYTTHVAPGHVVPKSLIHPRHCSRVYNHCCLEYIPKMEPERIIIVPPELAVLQHYRVCPGANVYKCDEKYNKTFVDKNILKYEKLLLPKVIAVLRTFNITV